MVHGEDITIDGKQGSLFSSDNSDLASAESGSSHDPWSPRTGTSTNTRPVQASKHRSKTLQQGTESVRPHLSDPAKVIVRYEVTCPVRKLYIQETDVPKVVSAHAVSSDDSGSIVVPDLEASKVPRAKKTLPWKPVAGSTEYEWVRGEGDTKETWRINVFFRRLHRDTYAFQDIYVNVSLLDKVDPNNKPFRTAYNKWVLQIARRRDASYTQKVVRVHWNVGERRALFTAINKFCSTFGIDRFGFSDDCRLSTTQLQIMADAVNAAPNPSRTEPRGIDAVRGQIASAHDKARPKNKAVFDLLAKGADFRARESAGERISRGERKPGAAIPLSHFPVVPSRASAARSIPSGKKRKRTAAVGESESSSELSSPAASVAGDDTWAVTDEEYLPGEEEGRSWSDISEVSSGEEESQVTGRKELTSPPSKKARVA